MFSASFTCQFLLLKKSELVHTEFVSVLLTLGFLSFLKAVCSVYTAFESGRFCWPVKQHICMFLGNVVLIHLQYFSNFSQLILKQVFCLCLYPLNVLSVTY